MQPLQFGALRILLIAAAIQLFLLTRTQIGAVVIGDCSGKGAKAKLVHVDIEKCGDKDQFCPFYRGTNATMEVAFETNAPFQKTKIDIVGSFGHIGKHFPIKPDDACGNYGFDCPVAANEFKQLKLTLPVKRIYPKGLLVQVVFKLLDENKNDIFCITFPAKIEDIGHHRAQIV